VAFDLLAEFADDRVRKLGVRVSNLDFAESDQATLGGFEPGEGGGSDGGVESGSASDRARATRAESAATDGDGGKLTDWVGGAPGAEAEADEAGDRGRGEPDDGQASLGDWS